VLLKNRVPAPRVTGNVPPNVFGGVKFSATMSGFEAWIDRVGCDYKSFAVAKNPFPHNLFAACMTACAVDSTCQAWNFDSRGTLMCFLKNCVPAPTVSGGGVDVGSGVKFSK